MKIVEREDGAVFSPEDPGEPSTGLARLSPTVEERELLAFLAHGKDVLEIGTGLGSSAVAMISTARSVTTVDIDPWVHKKVFPFLREKFGIRCLTSHFNLSLGPDHYTRYFDMVFIDGEHTKVALTEDIAEAERLCPRGVIVVHDAIELRDTLWDLGGWQIIETRYGIGIKYVGWEHALDL